MANESGKNERRINLPYWEGVNAITGRALAKKSEFAHVENGRSEVVGTIEKRKGQVVIGTNTYGGRFHSDGNYSVFYLPTTNGSLKHLFRISRADTASATLSVSVFDSLSLADYPIFSGSTTIFTIQVYENITLTEPPFAMVSDSSHFYIDNTDYAANIFSLGTNDQWGKLADTDAQNIPGGKFDVTSFDNNMLLVNGRADNRYLKADGATVVTSKQAGHLYNSPKAQLGNFYKNKLYVADYIQGGTRYPTTVLRSSYPSGVIALINGDVVASSTIFVTETKYFYTQSGMNAYEVYRGGSKIADLTVTGVNEISITVSAPVSLLSADEIWIAGTFTGEKQYRWVNSATAFGRDVKQYDTFKLSGGDNDPINMLTNIGNVMMIANRRNISTWNDYQLESFDLGIGCVGRRAYTKAFGVLYFLDYTGVYATSGGLPTIKSSPIQPYIDGATKAGKEASAAGHKGRSIFFTLGDVTLYHPDGAVKKVLRDVCIEHNLLQENWYIHTNVRADELETFIDTLDADRLILSGNSGSHQVYAFLEGNLDDGDVIFFQAETNPIPLADDLEAFANATGAIVSMERGAATEVFVSLDGESFFAIEGAAEKGITTLKITGRAQEQGKPPLCRRVTLSFRDSSKQINKIGPSAVLFLPAGTGLPAGTPYP